MYIYVCVCVYICTHEHRCLWKQEVLDPSRIGVRKGCKSPLCVVGMEF